MGETNLAPVEEQVMVNDDTSYELVETDEGGHKVLFYVMAGIVCLSGIGIPILVWRLIKRKKQLKQLQDQLAALQAAPVTPVAPTAEATEAPAATPEK